MSDEQEYISQSDHSVDPNEVVKFTQKLRYRVANDLTKNGTKIPDDITPLLNVLRDMDQSALTTRKLNIEEKSANDGRKALETFDRLNTLLGGKNPFLVDSGSTIQPERRVVSPTDGVILPEVTMIPGEDYQGEHTLNIADYVPSDD